MPDGPPPSDLTTPTPPQREDAAPAQTKPTGQRGALRRLAFWRRPDEPLDEVLGEGGASALTEAEREMIARVVAFDTKRVDDVMIPRADIVGVEAQTDLPGLLKAFAEAGHSRLPVFRGDLDDPVGMVHIKDVVGLLAAPEAAEGLGQREEQPLLEGLRRKVIYVPPSMPITDLLIRMQASRVHMALVIDEFGGTDGLVTIEDLIEEIVGDIRDEHDEEDEPVLKRTQGGRWDVDARIELATLAERTGLDLALPDEDADTLGGLVFILTGRVPVRGEVVRHPAGVEFEVADADPRRIKRVLIRTRRRRKRPVPEEAGATGAAGAAGVGQTPPPADAQAPDPQPTGAPEPPQAAKPAETRPDG